MSCRIDVYVHFCPQPPRGVKAGQVREVALKKGKKMAADVQYSYAPDTDTNVVNTATTFLVNSNPAGTVSQSSPAPGLVSYSQITPAAPALNVGDVVSTTTITTDSFGQSSQPVASTNSVTIQAIPPAPQGITPGTLKQVGSP